MSWPMAATRNLGVSFFLNSFIRLLVLLPVLACFPITQGWAEEPGVLRVGADVDYRPYSFLNDKGEPQGFDVELARLLGERLGLQVEFKLDQWETILEDLRADRLDLVVGMLFTISRTEDFAFTDPYNTDTISIFARDGSPIDTVIELNGRSMAILQGDATSETVLGANGIDSKIITFPTFTGALKSVSNGTAAYTLAPFAVGREIIEEARIPDISVVGEPVYTIQYRLAVNRSQVGFRDQVNRELHGIVGTPAYRELQDRWLHHERLELTFGGVIRYAAPLVLPALLALLVAWVWTLRRQVARQTSVLARQSRELEAQATHDSLTGLANRRLFDTIAEQEFRRCRRRGETFSVLFMDLDFFKQVNDTHGHATGDAVLCGFADRAATELREYDLLARYGGEEFVVLLRDTSEADALTIAERIRSACASAPFLSPQQNLPSRLTCSVGLAVPTDKDHCFEDVLARADDALYRAKHAGRNCVLVS